MLNNVITKEKIEQLQRFNDVIKVMDKMMDNMQLMANRIVKLEQQVEMLNDKK
tara:strand:+ start:232 stop:390 length:159 start_codon:yes stop_codon:yes gene_type:complete